VTRDVRLAAAPLAQRPGRVGRAAPGRWPSEASGNAPRRGPGFDSPLCGSLNVRGVSGVLPPGRW